VSKRIYIYSTLTGAVKYNTYAQDDGAALPRVIRSVLIKGGANLADKNLVTPKGVMTEITEEQLADLREISVFQLHEKNGFIKIETSNRDIEKTVSDMQARDESAPLTPDDFEDSEIKPEVTVDGKKKSNKK
jgi:hypothetical protein